MLALFLSLFVLCVLAEKLNYVIILVDDLGYNDINIGKGTFTRSNVKTPNLAQMATEGVLFDHFYAGSSMCTPSRGALLAGRFPPLFNWFGVQRVYFTPGQNTGFPHATVTSLASYLKGCGFSTGITGKWHLGRSQNTVEDLEWMPLKTGFDSAELVSPLGNIAGCTAGEIAPCQQKEINGKNVTYYPICGDSVSTWPCNTPIADFIPLNCTYGVQVPVGGNAGPDPKRNAGFCQFYRGNTIVQQPWEIANMTQRLTAEALKFFDARSKVFGDGKPFFFFFPHVAVHEPWFAGADFFGKSQMGTYGDMIEEMDWSVGQVLNRLKKSDIGPTHVYFVSDNGAFLEKNVGIANPAFQTSSGPLRGGKGQHYEGGVRTPAIVWGNSQSDQVVPLQRNLFTHAVGHTIDIYQTIFTQQSSTCPAPLQQLDGKDLTPVLTGTQPTSNWQVPNTYLPIFCENNLVAVRWSDPGFPAANIPPRDLKVLFAIVGWTFPTGQSCPVPNFYSPSYCICNNLVPLASPDTTANRTRWYQLFDINANVNENPAGSLLLTPNPTILNYYLTKLGQLKAWSGPFQQSYDSNPLSATGLVDLRRSSPSDITSLLSCPTEKNPKKKRSDYLLYQL